MRFMAVMCEEYGQDDANADIVGDAWCAYPGIQECHLLQLRWLS